MPEINGELRQHRGIGYERRAARIVSLFVGNNVIIRPRSERPTPDKKSMVASKLPTLATRQQVSTHVSIHPVPLSYFASFWM